MQQVRPVTITPQSVTVEENGEGAVLVVIGELSIPRPDRFPLGHEQLSKLRRLIRRADFPQLDIEAPIPVRKLMYTVRQGTHSVRVVEGAIPPRLAPRIVFLHGLISRYGSAT
jgi:hypothetical protein